MPLLLAITTYPRAVAAILVLAWLASACLHWRWPLLCDAALIALYAAWPSLPLLFVGAAIDMLRWLPVTSREFAVMVGAEQSIGATRALWRLVLAGWHQETPGSAERALPPVHVAIGQTTKLETRARPLAPAEWFQACNDDPTAPHLGVVGPTRLGKTTFVLALIGRWKGELVITTTKDDTWAGADVTRPAIRLDQGVVDWQPVIEVIGRVHFEMLRRYGEKDTKAPALRLVIDEFTTTLANVPAKTKQQVTELWSMGAAAGVRVVVIAQEVNARAWGLEGRRDILGNLLFARVAPGRLWALGRLGPNGELLGEMPLDTAGLVTLAGEAQLRGRGWRRAAPAAPAGSVPVGSPPTQGAGNVPGTGNTNAGTPIEMLKKLRNAGVTREQARNAGFAFRDEHWTKAGDP